MAWIGKLIGTAIGGPGVVVLGDPGFEAEATDDAEDADESWPPWAYRLAGIGIMSGVLAIAGMPWPILILIGAVGMLVVLVEWRRG